MLIGVLVVAAAMTASTLLIEWFYAASADVELLEQLSIRLLFQAYHLFWNLFVALGLFLFMSAGFHNNVQKDNEAQT